MAARTSLASKINDIQERIQAIKAAKENSIKNGAEDSYIKHLDFLLKFNNSRLLSLQSQENFNIAIT